MAQVAREMDRYKLEIVGLSEIRWPGKGEIRTDGDKTLMYSGREESEARASGVGLLISKRAKQCLLEWNPVSDRIITARFQSKVRKITVIQCYAPTERAEMENKTLFYNTLSGVTDKINKGDIIIVCGDLNAQVGGDNQDFEEVMGKHGIGNRNENGDMYIEYCLNNNLVIGGTLFTHKRIHKVTWVSPDHHTENQIDHIAISTKWRHCLMDVRNKRGADIASDHHLVVATVKLRITAKTKPKRNKARMKYNIPLLKNREVADKYRTELDNNLKNTKTAKEITPNWKILTECIHKASAETLSAEKEVRKNWITDPTWKLINDRKDCKAKINAAVVQSEKQRLTEEYTRINRNVKRAARNDKRQWAEQLAKEAQTAADRNDMKTIYRITKQLANKNYVNSKPLKDEHGKLITGQREQLQRWEEFFKQKPEQIEQPVQLEGRQEMELDINTEPPTKEEIRAVIQSLKNGKTAGPDNISNEMLKAHDETISEELHLILSEIWQSEQVPKEWKEGTIVKLPKKGDLSICSNWRGITLLNTYTKILSTILANRITKEIETRMRQEQVGFRTQRSCTEHINTVRIIVEQSVEWRSPLYLVFIDFKRAFDTINYYALWQILKMKGVPRKIINIIQQMYEGSSSKIVHEGEMSRSIEVSQGVKQGCPLSPILFNLALDWVMQQAIGEQEGMVWNTEKKLNDLDYADDICLIAQKYTEMQKKLQNTSDMGKKIGLVINTVKTKAMRLQTNNTRSFQINGEAIKDVTHFTYLGSIISTDGGSERDIKARIGKAAGSFGTLKQIWNSAQITQNLKLRIFNTNVKAVLLYGSETWALTRGNINKVQVFINKCLRKIIKVKWSDFISNEELWQRTRQEEIGIQIKRRKWRWIGHILRREDGNIAKTALVWNPQGSRRRGKPNTTWRRTIMKEVEEMGKTWNEIKVMAQNREEWRRLIKEIQYN